jgi:hypothetical protein
MEDSYSWAIRFQLHDAVQNFDALLADPNGLHGAFLDWCWQLPEVLFDGEPIAARYADTGTHLGLFQGVERSPDALSVETTKVLGCAFVHYVTHVFSSDRGKFMRTESLHGSRASRLHCTVASESSADWLRASLPRRREVTFVSLFRGPPAGRSLLR